MTLLWIAAGIGIGIWEASQVADFVGTGYATGIFFSTAGVICGVGFVIKAASKRGLGGMGALLGTLWILLGLALGIWRWVDVHTFGGGLAVFLREWAILGGLGIVMIMLTGKETLEETATDELTTVKSGGTAKPRRRATKKPVKMEKRTRKSTV